MVFFKKANNRTCPSYNINQINRYESHTLEPIRIYFSDVRSSAGVRQAIARVFTDWTTGVIREYTTEIIRTSEIVCGRAWLYIQRYSKNGQELGSRVNILPDFPKPTRSPQDQTLHFPSFCVFGERGVSCMKSHDTIWRRNLGRSLIMCSTIIEVSDRLRCRNLCRRRHSCSQ